MICGLFWHALHVSERGLIESQCFEVFQASLWSSIFPTREPYAPSLEHGDSWWKS